MQDVVHQEHLEQDHWWFRARRDIFGPLLDQRLARDGRSTAERRILDVGPGSGVNLPVLRDRGRVTVLDVSRFSLETCRAGGAHSLVQADATRPPFREGAFDLVCALDVFEHLENDLGAMEACRRSLRPGGVLFATVPALPLLWGRQDVLAQHHRRYRRAQFAERLEQAGFEVERLTYFNTLLFPPILAVRLAMRPFLPWTRAGKSDLGMASPFGVDRAFHRIFASERRWLERRGFPVGVSLLCFATPRA